MKTTIDTCNFPFEVDLRDIGAMVGKYCKEIDRLEECIEELESENAELKAKIIKLESYIEDLEA